MRPTRTCISLLQGGDGDSGGLTSGLVRAQYGAPKVCRRLIKMALHILGIEIPASVWLPVESSLRHGGVGVVINRQCTLGKGVRIYPGVKLVRSDVWRGQSSMFGGIVVEDDVILGAGAIVIASGSEPLRIGRGSVIGAGAVLTKSTGENQVWAGNPASCIRVHDGQP